MIWLAIGAGLLAFFVWLGRRSGAPMRNEWRSAAAVVALAALVGGAALALRGAWLPGLLVGVGGLALAGLSRRLPRSPPVPSALSSLSDADARRMLGVTDDAGPEEIQAAYTRLMKRVHPDAGGAAGLAAQLNAARDRLLRK